LRKWRHAERVFIHGCDAGDEDEWRSFLATHGFGELIACGRGRDVAVAVPTQFVLAGDEVLAHFVRANPIWAAIEENPNVLFTVSGDWAYVPSSWKAIGDEDPARGIPTTYYASVQLTGVAQVVDDADGVADVLRALLGSLQPDVEVVDPMEHGARLQAIRAVRIGIAEVRAKFKYGGNVDAEHRAAVAARLEQRDGPGDRAAIGHLQRRLQRGGRAG
jgi:transcriptional regulator